MSEQQGHDAKPVELSGHRYSLRTIDYHDTEALHELDVQCFAENRAFTEGYFLLLFMYENASGFALESGEELAAFVLLTKNRKTGNIATIDVHPDHRRRGIGAFLIRQAEHAFLADGIRTATLQVEPDNLAALSLYRQLGYQHKKTLKNYYVDADAYLMVKQLQG